VVSVSKMIWRINKSKLIDSNLTCTVRKWLVLIKT